MLARRRDARSNRIMRVPTDSLPDDPGTLKAMLLAERTRAERLEQIIREMQRHRFGRRAETLPEDQLLLGFEEVEPTAAGEEADHEAKSPAEREARASKRRANRGSLPSHLPRVEMVVDVQDQSCEDRSERLDIVPAQFRVERSVHAVTAYVHALRGQGGKLAQLRAGQYGESRL